MGSKTEREPDRRRSPLPRPPSPQPGTKGPFECRPRRLTIQRFSLGSRCSHNTNSLSYDINSFFKKKNKTAPSITAHGPSQWHGPGCQRSVKGASVPRSHPPYLLSPAHARALVSPGCSDDFSPSAALTEFAGCRLPADAKQLSSCAWAALPSLQSAGEKTCLCGLLSIAL